MSSAFQVPQRTPRVFFANLPPFRGETANDAAKNDLIDLCRPYGAITDIVVHPLKGTAFATFPTLQAAEYAIFRLHDSNYSGDTISVNWAKTQEEREREREEREFRRNNWNNRNNTTNATTTTNTTNTTTKSGKQTSSPTQPRQSQQTSGSTQPKQSQQTASPTQSRQQSQQTSSPSQSKHSQQTSSPTQARQQAPRQTTGSPSADPALATEQDKKEVPVEKPRLAQQQQPIEPKKAKPVSEPEKVKPYSPVTVRPAVAPVVQRFRVTIESETSNAQTTLSITEEEYLKYILPLLKRQHTGK